MRATKDVDLLAPPDERNMARRLEALAGLRWGLATELDPAEMVKKPITIIGDEPRVDVLTLAWTVTFERAWPNRVVRRIEAVRVPFLSLKDLLESKQTGRPADLADLDVLTGLRGPRR
ncbi:MAG: hypothetical protein AB7I50_05960 [Vicinamibacterales bacterium]